jgi:hypothetical protein
MHRHQVELGDIGAGRQFDASRILRSTIGIVEAQPLSDFSGFDTDGGVVAGIVTGRPAEDFDADGALFEHVAMALKSVFNHIAQEILAAFAGMKLVGSQDPAQLFAYLFLGRWHAPSTIRRRHWRARGRMSLRHDCNGPILPFARVRRFG